MLYLSLKHTELIKALNYYNDYSGRCCNFGRFLYFKVVTNILSKMKARDRVPQPYKAVSIFSHVHRRHCSATTLRESKRGTNF
jgi:hypothetical protein